RILSPELRRLYHVSADRYYLFLKGVSLGEACNRAETLRLTLAGEYRINARQALLGRLIPRDRLLELPDVTVRLGVSSYKYSKLIEVLGRYPAEFAVAETRAALMLNLDESLDLGQREGGNVVISWDPVTWGYRRWSPYESA